MARYTELFGEYRENNALPTIFGDIQGFGDLFDGYYCDKEIGFETETLFKIKLENKANLVVPIYKDKLTRYVTAWAGTSAPTKVHYTERDIDFTKGNQANSMTHGAQSVSQMDLPINGTSATPSSKTDSNSFVDNSTDGQRLDTTEEDTTVTESGLTVQEAWFVLDKINEKAQILTLELLKEFESLFMGVY